jgi:hypothetical protein
MAKAKASWHPEDYERYREILESTRDAEGVVHRDEAVKKLTEELAARKERAAEYAASRAHQVADGFDNTHKPETENGQMALEIETYLIIGENERVQVDRASAKHTRQWLDVQNIAKAKHDAAHAAKTLHGYKLLAIQDEHGCSMWKAEEILNSGRGRKPAEA